MSELVCKVCGKYAVVDVANLIDGHKSGHYCIEHAPKIGPPADDAEPQNSPDRLDAALKVAQAAQRELENIFAGTDREAKLVLQVRKLSWEELKAKAQAAAV